MPRVAAQDRVPPVADVPSRWTSAARRGRAVLPGLAVAGVVAAVATALGAVAPLLGGPVLAIVLGLLAGVVLRRRLGENRLEPLRPGLDCAARPVLQAAIVLFGATLPLAQVAAVGVSTLPVMLGTLMIALLGAWLLGRLLNVRGDTQLLIGVGTAICGASAIAATQSVLRARQAHVAYALGTVLAANLLAVLTFGPIGHLLGLDDAAFGLWAGTAINDTSSVVAAAYAYGAEAGPYAVVVKLARSLMIIPIVLALGVWLARRHARSASEASAAPSWWRIVPLFLVGFLAASALASTGVVPAGWHAAITATGTFLITVALAGIGLALRPAEIRAAGARPLLFGTALWVLVAAGALGLQALTGRL